MRERWSGDGGGRLGGIRGLFDGKGLLKEHGRESGPSDSGGGADQQFKVARA